MVIITAPNDLSISRYAIAAGRSVGNAVSRNRVKRRLRSNLDAIFYLLRPGWDLIIYGRRPLLSAKYIEIRLAMNEILQKADLLISEY